MLDLTNPPPDFIENPYPYYRRLRAQRPLLEQSDGSYLVSRHKDLDGIYKDTHRYSSDKKSVFKPRFGDSPLFEHHTTSLVFNDPPLHTRVRKIMVGAMTPKAIAGMETGLINLVDELLDDLPSHCVDNELDIVCHFASRIPLNVIGNLFDIPVNERGPLRDWSLAILGALEPTLSSEQKTKGDTAVREFSDYLTTLVADRKRYPGNPESDVLTRLIYSKGEKLSHSELLQNCIFTLNAGHETTTNLIANALCSLHEYPEQKKLLVNKESVLGTAIDEFLRFESPNQLGNRLTTESVSLMGRTIPPGTNLHLMIGAANRDSDVFTDGETLDITRAPNKHLAFAGGPHSCLGLNLARMEGRIAIGRFIRRYPDFSVTEKVRSHRLRFRGFTQLKLSLGNHSNEN
ncbi:MAG: cytochrome P450 [Granulosicoccus sp.]